MSDFVVGCPFPVEDLFAVPEESFVQIIWKTMEKHQATLAVVCPLFLLPFAAENDKNKLID